ncbi:hypothetical protein O3G_MSEX007903 [Manduca sexta]|uniref:Reverse transcriptase domain-containing protein n=1 Tax=Manduca sexta TaxID=7130 RepID=A0A921Z826_MANSE|nr:hypothetical protein O3G_MSEX007903 [Manduca sexta]
MTQKNMAILNIYRIMGIHGSLLRWCESYLKNRSQLIAIRGFTSKIFTVPSGVPQGSHLGPLFFLVFINDICDNIDSKYKLFADDLKLYRTIKTTADIRTLQWDIDKIYRWCLQNNMHLNFDKCHFIKFSRKKNTFIANYTIHNNPLSEVAYIKDLGIIFDRKINFKNHFDHVISNSSKLSGFLVREMKIFKEPLVTISIYNSIIRSMLEYSSPVWNPFYQAHSNRIEMVQKRFLYHLCYSDNKCRTFNSYLEKLNHYRMTTLKVRRKISDLIFLYKLLHGKINSPQLLQAINISIPRPCSRLSNRKTFVLPTS